jgi:LmbE family N-acetylglucosaminyl deacetylase
MALRDAGHRVVNVACGLGRPAQADRREAELREACLLAGFELRIAEPAIAMSASDDRAAARANLLRLIRLELDDLRPEVVLSPSPHDRHPAHELVGRAVRDAMGGHAGSPRWWMWGLWSSLPLPTLGTAFGAARLDEIVAALSAHRGELERNDYRRLVGARAEMNATLAPELLFGFGAAAPGDVSRVELLTEVAWVDDHWRLGRPRWLDPTEPLAEPSDVAADAWLLAPSATELIGGSDSPAV